MANLNTAFFIEGRKIEGSPQGVISGERGFKVEDSLTNSVYECLGGTSWRKISEGLTHLRPRSFSSLSDIQNIKDFQKGEVATLRTLASDNSALLRADYKVVYNEKKVVREVTTGTIPSNSFYRSLRCVDSKFIPAGSELSVTFKVVNQGDLNPLNESVALCYLLDVDGGFVVREYRDNPRLQLTLANNSNLILKSITNESGVVGLESGYINYDEWTTATYTTSQDKTVKYGMFANTAAGKKISIKEIVVLDDVFTFKNDPDLTTWVSDNGVSTMVPSENNGDTYNPTVLSADYVPDSGFILSGDNSVLQLSIYNNVISPIMLGADPTLNQDFEIANDVSDILQICFDSPYHVDIPSGMYYITKELTVNKPKNITMYGRHIPVIFTGKDGFDQEMRRQLSIHKSLTIIYSDQNINYITIKSSGVNIKNGLLYTGLSVGHNLAAYKYDLNYRIWGGTLEEVCVLGGVNNMLTKDSGTLGLYFNVDEDASPYAGNLTMMKFSGIIHNCQKGVYLPSADADTTTWFNSMDFDFFLLGCKKYYEVLSGGFYNIKGMIQDSPILIDGEEDEYWGNDLKISNSTIDLFIYDRHITDNYLGVDYVAHQKGNMRVKGTGNTLLGKSLYDYNIGTVSFKNINEVNPINDPNNLFISKRGATQISEINNAVRFLGDKTDVTFKGYDGDQFSSGDTWFENNLYESDNALNSETLTENSSACTIVEPVNGSILKAASDRYTHGFQIKKDFYEYGFAELVMPLDFNQKLTYIKAVIDDSDGIFHGDVLKMQLILRNTDEPNQLVYSHITDDYFSYERNAYELFISNPIVKYIFDGDVCIYKGSDTIANIKATTGSTSDDLWECTDSGVDDDGTAVAVGGGLRWDGVSKWLTVFEKTITKSQAKNSSWNHAIVRFIGNNKALNNPDETDPVNKNSPYQGTIVVQDIFIQDQYQARSNMIHTGGNQVINGPLSVTKLKLYNKELLTGNDIDVSDVNGSTYNVVTPSGATFFEFSALALGGWARTFISTYGKTDFPLIYNPSGGLSKRQCETVFEADEIYDLFFTTPDGINIDYEYKKRIN